MANNILVEFRNVTKHFPGVTALGGVDWAVNRGEVHILIGENGAGKSSLVKLLAGIYHPDAGEIIFDGQPYKPRTPVDAFRAGIRVVHQELNLLPYLTIAENLLLESLPQQLGIVQFGDMRRRARALLDEVGLEVSPDTRVEQLGIAQMQLLEIAKAICYESKLLILDEPTATLTTREIERLFIIVKRLQAKGVTFLYISHRLNEIYEIGDRVTVLRNGQHITTRAVSDVGLNELIKLMVGREISDEHRFRAGVKTGAEVLWVDGLKLTPNSPSLSFTAHAGEIVGIAGLVGSGRTEAMRAVFGADRKAAGQIAIDGQRVVINKPRDAVRYGLCLLTEDRKSQGLMLDLPISTNISITNLARISRAGLLRKPVEADAASDLVRDLHIRTPSIAKHVRFLSGGNQQKVVISKWLFRGSRVLIFDEPTRGIDVGARQEIYDLLWDLAAAGKGLIIVSSDLSELTGLCHRILVFSKGKIVGEVERAAFEQEHILSLAYQEYIHA